MSRDDIAGQFMGRAPEDVLKVVARHRGWPPGHVEPWLARVDFAPLASAEGEDFVEQCLCLVSNEEHRMRNNKLWFGPPHERQKKRAQLSERGIDIDRLLAERSHARLNKDYRAADAIRDAVTAAGVLVVDLPNNIQIWDLCDVREHIG